MKFTFPAKNAQDLAKKTAQIRTYLQCGAEYPVHRVVSMHGPDEVNDSTEPTDYYLKIVGLGTAEGPNDYRYTVEWRMYSRAPQLKTHVSALPE